MQVVCYQVYKTVVLQENHCNILFPEQHCVALPQLKANGKKVGMIHFTELWPLPDYEFPEKKNYWTVESNMTGQLACLLRSEYQLKIKGSLIRYDGLPLTGEYIRRQLHD